MNNLGLKKKEMIKMPKKSKEEKLKKKTYLGEISDEKKEIFKELIKKYKDIFEYDKENLGKVNKVKYKIKIKKEPE